MKKALSVLVHVLILGVLGWVVIFRLMRACSSFSPG